MSKLLSSVDGVLFEISSEELALRDEELKSRPSLTEHQRIVNNDLFTILDGAYKKVGINIATIDDGFHKYLVGNVELDPDVNIALAESGYTNMLSYYKECNPHLFDVESVIEFALVDAGKEHLLVLYNAAYNMNTRFKISRDTLTSIPNYKNYMTYITLIEMYDKNTAINNEIMNNINAAIKI